VAQSVRVIMRALDPPIHWHAAVAVSYFATSV